MQVCLHLTAVMKCFFKRPPETQKAVGVALAAGLSDFQQDVQDRALFYYQLLQYNVSVAECAVNPPKQAILVFADTQSSEIKDHIFDEFSSLSIVYQKQEHGKASIEEKPSKDNERTQESEHGGETQKGG
ncbi:hypothetical protein VNO77_31210 [Canavalia gladiata]|uniref:Uncharacterized protein n=1 Tax=Canavalia gladiata TaxID=3824 RepID=A0AAN9K195_CANGL